VGDPEVYVIIERYKDAAAVAAHGQGERAKATPRRVELTIRLTTKPPACAGGFVLLATKVLIDVP